MKRKLITILLIMIFVVSCAPGTAVPTPTATTIPTAIITPTITPIPGDYPSPLGEKAVFTYYFYWYDSQTGEHLGPHGPARDADPMTDQPVAFPAITWRGTEWHRKQIEDMIYAGVDVILPVYWGASGTEWWARPGIVNLANALEEVRLSGQTPPAVAMFYDTNTHLYEPVNLSTDIGKNTVYSEIKFFFNAIPKKYWALTENRQPMIWFYAPDPFGKIDQFFLENIKSQFERDFGIRPYIVVDSGWIWSNVPVKYDAASIWIAAGSGSTAKITTVSPGVDDRWLLEYPNHSYVDRQNGVIYRNAWMKDIICQTPWTVIESWNEYHEGTDISETIEYGRKYLDLTREYTEYFKKGILPEGGLISEYKEASQVSAKLGEESTALGLASGAESEGDGASTTVERAGEEARMNTEGAPYMYFDVDDGFYFNSPQPIEITIRYFDEGSGTIYLEYDTATCASDWNVETMYKQIPIVTQGDSRIWKTASITLDDATFAGHQNGFSDFRIAGYETPLIISQVTINKIIK